MLYCYRMADVIVIAVLIGAFMPVLGLFYFPKKRNQKGW